MMETKEWYDSIKNILAYRPSMPAPAPRAAKKSGDNADESMNESVEHQIRNQHLKSTIDKGTKLQNYKVLNFSSQENMIEFLGFMTEHMAFTERMINFCLCLGDIVEQSVRKTNLEQFQKNKKKDKKLFKIAKEKIYKQKLKEARKMQAEEERRKKEEDALSKPNQNYGRSRTTVVNSTTA